MRAAQVGRDSVDALSLAYAYLEAYRIEKEASGALDFADLVVLTESVPDQVPTVMTADGVVARLIALARYADTVEASVSGEDDL